MLDVTAIHDGVHEWASRTALLPQVLVVRATVDVVGADPIRVEEGADTAPAPAVRRGRWGRRTETARTTPLRLQRRVRGADGTGLGDIELELVMVGDDDQRLLADVVTDGLVAVVRTRISDGVERRRDDHLDGVIRQGDLSAATRDALLEESVVAVGLVSVELASLGRFTRVNHRLQRLAGRRAEELVGLSYLELLEQPQRGQQESGLRRAVGGRRVPIRSEGRLLVPGVDVGPWVRVTATPVLDVLDHPVLATVQLQRVEAEEASDLAVGTGGGRRSPVDRPTAVLDPAGFAEVVDEARARASRTERPSAMYTARIEGWDDLVRRFGTEVAEDAVRHVAARLRGALRADDAIAMVSSHEFAFIAEEIDPDQAVALAQRVTSSMGADFDSGGRRVPLELGLGVSMVEAGAPTSVLLDRTRRAVDDAWPPHTPGPVPGGPSQPEGSAGGTADAEPLTGQTPRYFSNRRKPTRYDRPPSDGWHRARR